MQVIIGSYPHGDGTFDKANDFQSVVVDGAWSMGLGTLKLHSGQVAYVVPAAKGAHAPVSKTSFYDYSSKCPFRLTGCPCIADDKGSEGLIYTSCHPPTAWRNSWHKPHVVVM